MHKKTIILVHNVDFPQQGAIDIFYYAKYLSQYDDVHVKVIISKVQDAIFHNNLEFIELGSTNYLFFIIKAFFSIQKIHKQGYIEYVYFFAQHPFSVLLQGGVKYILKIKTIYDVVSGPIGDGWISQLAKLTIQLGVYFSDKFVVLNKGLMTTLGLPRSKEYIVVPMGYDDVVFKSMDIDILKKGKNEIIFTYIGTLDTSRNLDIFVQAFIQHIDNYNHIRLYIIGGGNGENAIRKVAEKYINTHVFLLGKKPHHTIPNYINSSDVLVSYVPKMNYFEYQPPTKLIEYLACNKPAIATNTVAQQEILAGYEFLIHQDDLQSTIEQIFYCINNIDTIQQHNYSKIIEGYSWKKLVDRIKVLIG